MRTLKNCQTPDMWTSLVEDFRVKTLALREKVLVSPEVALGYGVRCIESYGKLDLDTSSLRTAQCSLFEDLSGSYATFPKSGMMSSGNVYQAQTLAYNRVGNGYIVLPTPVKSTANGACKNRYFGSPTYRGNIQEYIRDGEQDSQYPHPDFLESLMNFPIGWTERIV